MGAHHTYYCMDPAADSHGMTTTVVFYELLFFGSRGRTCSTGRFRMALLASGYLDLATWQTIYYAFASFWC